MSGDSLMSHPMEQNYVFFNMKILRLFSVLSIAALLFSCKEENETIETVQLPAPVVTQDEARSGANQITARWSAISEAVGYNVIFDDDDAVVVMANEMTWENLEPETEHSVRVQAVPGDKKKYSESEWSEPVVMKTSAFVEDKAPFTITFSNIDFYKAEAHIESSYDEAYFFEVTPKVLFDKEYAGDLDAFAVDYVAQVKQMADLSDKTFGDMWLIFKYDGSKDNDFTIGSLASEVEYIGIAFGVDIDGNITTKCASATFTTLKDPGVTPSKMTFDIGVEFVKETSVRLTVTPSSDDEWYFYAAINKSQLPGETDEAIISYYEKQFDQYLEGETFEDFAKENLSKGKDSYTYNGLQDNAEYVAIAFGVTYHGELCLATTGLTRKEFHTGEISVGPGADEIELTVNKLTSTDIDATIIPSDKKKYYLYDFLTFDRFKGMSDEEIMAKVINDRSGYLWLTATMDNTTYKNVNDLVPGTEYILFAFYVEKDPNDPYSAVPAGKLFKMIVTAPDEGGNVPDKPSLTFAIVPGEVTSSSIEATVTPSDASAKYISALVEASKYSGKSDEEIIKGVIGDLGYDIYGSEKTGTTKLSSSRCKPETEYLAVAFGIDDSYNANSGLTKRTIKTASESSAPAEGIAITVKEVTATRILAEFKPADATMTYIPMLFKASDLEGKTDEAIISEMISEDEMNWYGLGQKGTYTLDRSSCTANTDYVLAAVGLTGSHAAATGLFRQSVKTKAE